MTAPKRSALYEAVEKYASPEFRALLELIRPGSTLQMKPAIAPTHWNVSSLPPLTERSRSKRDIAMHQAWLAFRAALKRGDLVKPEVCSRCGSRPPSRDLHGHHPDYAKPLEVEWLCRPCHNKAHARRTR